jgi:hypothetical protein
MKTRNLDKANLTNDIRATLIFENIFFIKRNIFLNIFFVFENIFIYFCYHISS